MVLVYISQIDFTMLSLTILFYFRYELFGIKVAGMELVYLYPHYAFLPFIPFCAFPEFRSAYFAEEHILYLMDMGMLMREHVMFPYVFSDKQYLLMNLGFVPNFFATFPFNGFYEGFAVPLPSSGKDEIYFVLISLLYSQ